MLQHHFHYLKTECRRSDYTFLGLRKILESFLGKITKAEDNKKGNSTFWIMLNDIPMEKKETYPDEIKTAIAHLYDNFDYNHLSRIADGTFYAIRFFLFDMKMDYMSDPLMHTATIDMIKEIEHRLSIIFENRRPRKGWRR